LRNRRRAPSPSGVGYSRALLDFSRPGIDAVIASDLGRDFGTKGRRPDSERLCRVGADARAPQRRQHPQRRRHRHHRGDLPRERLDGVQRARRILGIGNPNPDDYLTIVHPRRLAWARGNTTGIQAQALVSGIPGGQPVPVRGAGAIAGGGLRHVS
jgi:hypothetical protein